MIFFTKYFLRRKIKNELLRYIENHLDLKNKNISQVKKSDLDSVDLMSLVQFIEEHWGKIQLADLYKANTLDDIVTLILKNKSI